MKKSERIIFVTAGIGYLILQPIAIASDKTFTMPEKVICGLGMVLVGYLTAKVIFTNKL